MITTLINIAEALTAPITWWLNQPELMLLAAVTIAACIALTIRDNQRTAITDDDEYLDRLGSAIPGQPTSDLDEALLAARDAIEADPIPPLVDTDTAITVIRGAAA